MLVVTLLIVFAGALAAAFVVIGWHANTNGLKGRGKRAAEWFLNVTAPPAAPVMSDAELEELLREGNCEVEEPEWVPAVQHRVNAIVNSPAIRDVRRTTSRAALALVDGVRR
ncbi:hypothetical protein ACFVAJ_18670 [Agromyces sp. NPDC057679]|uniref:hypothetical protein n=1 Tax=Agromyces sp. NPDC057679 TaxID=3346207 RepID=UPI00366F145F